MAEAAAGKTCPKCAYKRTAAETAPDWQCPKCGIAYAKAAGAPAAAPQSAAPQTPAQASMAPSAPSGFIESVKAGLSSYATFSGRAARAEYWWFFLFWIIVLGVTGLINETFGVLAVLALLLPSLAMSVRRLHDIGKSGWFYLINLIPLIGPLIVLYWAVQPSEGDNDYGAAARS
jgi:uncharacterized membrane protein YhaH (DUF805 family)